MTISNAGFLCSLLSVLKGSTLQPGGLISSSITACQNQENKKEEKKSCLSLRTQHLVLHAKNIFTWPKIQRRQCFSGKLLLPLTFGGVSITSKEKENGFWGMISPIGLLAYVQNLVLDSEEKL